MASSRARGLATAADIEDERQEVVHGALVRKASPSFEHGSAQRALGFALGSFHGPPRAGWPGGWWLAAEVEVELESHDVYLPDIAGWRIDRVPERPRGRPVRIAPDWVCELLSPSTMARDLGPKQRTYHLARVGHYWVVEPVEGVLSVYRWHESGYVLALVAGPDEVVRAEPFDAIDIHLADVFGPREP